MNENNQNKPTAADPFASESDWLEDLGELPQPVVCHSSNWKDRPIGKLSVVCGGSVLFGLLGGAFAAQLLSAGDLVGGWLWQMFFSSCSYDRFVYLRGWSEMGVAALALISVFLSYSHGFLGRLFVSRRTSAIAWLSVFSLYSAFIFQTGILQVTLANVINVGVVVAVAAAAFLMGEKVCTSLSLVTDPLKLYQASLIGLLPAVVLLSPAASASLFLTLATCLSVPLLTGYVVASKLNPSTRRSAALFSITSLTPLTVCLPFLLASLFTGLVLNRLTMGFDSFGNLIGCICNSSSLWAMVLIATVAYPAVVSGSLIGFAATPARRNIGIAGPEEVDCSASRVAKLRG